MNKREYLISLGLAKPGKGRFSAAGKAAIEKAIAEGMVFDEPEARPVSDKPRKPKVAKVVEKAPDKGLYDAKAVRAWGVSKGLMEAGKRGRVPAPVIKAYLEAFGTRAEVVTPVKRVVKTRAKVREVTVGYTYARRGKNDKPFISEPLVAVMSCGQCAKGVAFCGCSNGPVAPKYLGGEPLMLEKPAA